MLSFSFWFQTINSPTHCCLLSIHFMFYNCFHYSWSFLCRASPTVFVSLNSIPSHMHFLEYLFTPLNLSTCCQVTTTNLHVSISPCVVVANFSVLNYVCFYSLFFLLQSLFSSLFVNQFFPSGTIKWLNWTDLHPHFGQSVHILVLPHPTYRQHLNQDQLVKLLKYEKKNLKWCFRTALGVLTLVCLKLQL